MVPRLSLTDYISGNDHQKQEFIKDLIIGLKEYVYYFKRSLSFAGTVDTAYKKFMQLFHLPLDSKMIYGKEEFKSSVAIFPFASNVPLETIFQTLKSFGMLVEKLVETIDFRYIILKISAKRNRRFQGNSSRTI